MKKYPYKLYGAILGDLCGQPYEFPISAGPHSKVLLHNPDSHITDDTIMTLASASSLMYGNSIESDYKYFGNKYDGDYYGKGFKEWLKKPIGTTNDSYGNGCLMRISPFMYVENSLPMIMESVLCSHKHQISIESVLKLYYAYQGKINHEPAPVNDKVFKVEADATIHWCLWFFDRISYSTQERILGIVSNGGDTDTNASIVGELSNFWEKDITEADAEYVESKLDDFLLTVLKDFNEKF